MSVVTVADLFKALVRHQLLKTEQQAKLTKGLRQYEQRYPGAREFAAALSQGGWLTPFQAEQLLAGKGDTLALGPYLMLERLGAGGMGEVFKARHRDLGRLTAIKVIRPDVMARPAAVERFRREARVAAQLAHPNVVLVYDFGQAPDGSSYMAMEYVDGVDLARLLGGGTALPVPQACDYVRQAALGLQHASERGLVHRDIKPSNLMVTPPPSAGGPAVAAQVKVLDLGLARLNEDAVATEAALTHSGALMGTPDYMAPEQAADAHAADTRSDIYSLGCTLYHLLTGRVPFDGKTLYEKLRKHETTPPASASTLRRDLPVGLVKVLERMMAKNPAQRFQRPVEVATALAPFCEGPSSTLVLPADKPGRSSRSSISSKPTMPLDAAGKPVDHSPWRKRAVIAGGGAAVLVVLLLVGLALRKKDIPAPPVDPPSSDGLVKVVDVLKPVDGGTSPDPVKVVPKDGATPGGTDKGKAKRPRPVTPARDRPPPVATLIVSAKGDGQHTTIRAAIAAAPERSRLLIRPGTYAEGIILHKDLELVGDGPPGSVVIESTDTDCLNLTANDSIVRNLTLRCKLTDPKKQCYGVDIPRGKHLLEDCDITCGSLIGLAVHGASAEPLLRRCKIHDCANTGLRFGEGARGTAVDCEMVANSGPGVVLTTGCAPTLIGCTIRDSKQGGIFALSKGGGHLHECKILANAKAGAEIKEEADPLFVGCTFADGKTNGLLIHIQGRGRFEDCEVRGHVLAGIEVYTGGDPTLTRCTFRDGQQGGIFILDGGKGTFEDCQVTANTKIGVEVKKGGDPILRRCRIFSGKAGGVGVWEKAGGRFEDCEIYANGGVGAHIEEEGDPLFLRCKFHDSPSSGVTVAKAGKGRFEDCDIVGNGKSGIVIGEKATPVIRKCRVNRNGGGGVFAFAGAGGSVEDCDLTSNALAGFGSEPGASVACKNNKE